MINLSAQLMTPFLNNNGTARCDLVASRLEAKEAIYAAMKALQEMRPNSRDYIGKDAIFDLDVSIYSARFSALDAIHNALYDEAIIINDCQ